MPKLPIKHDKTIDDQHVIDGVVYDVDLVDDNGYILKASCTTVPANSIKGFADGAEIIVSSGDQSTVYRNQGDETSSVFVSEKVARVETPRWFEIVGNTGISAVTNKGEIFAAFDLATGQARLAAASGDNGIATLLNSYDAEALMFIKGYPIAPDTFELKHSTATTNPVYLKHVGGRFYRFVAAAGTGGSIATINTDIFSNSSVVMDDTNAADGFRLFYKTAVGKLACQNLPSSEVYIETSRGMLIEVINANKGGTDPYVYIQGGNLIANMGTAQDIDLASLGDAADVKGNFLYIPIYFDEDASDPSEKWMHQNPFVQFDFPVEIEGANQIMHITYNANASLLGQKVYANYTISPFAELQINQAANKYFLTSKKVTPRQDVYSPFTPSL